MFVKFFKGWQGSDDIAIHMVGTVTGEGLNEGLKLIGQSNYKALWEWWNVKGHCLTFKEVESERLEAWVALIFERMGLVDS